MPLDMAGVNPNEVSALQQKIGEQQTVINNLMTTINGLTPSSSLTSVNNKISALEGLVSTLQTSTQNAVKLATNVMPVAEDKLAKVGSGNTAARDDHVHKRLSTAGLNPTSTDVNGFATVAFDQTFVDPPGVVFTAIENNTNPIPRFKIMTWAVNNGLIVGCTVYAERDRPLPNIGLVSGLLTAVITGVNSLVTALTGYKAFEIATSIQFTFVAIKSSKGS